MSAPLSTSPIGDTARLVRVELDADVAPAAAASGLYGDAHPVALSGAWAGGAGVLASEPVALARRDDDPFCALDRQPAIDGDAPGAVGGGWIGYLGYGLGARVEPVPPSPPRPVPIPPFALAFYDHVVHCDGDGRWWFEALWTDARAAVLEGRLALWRERLAAVPAAPKAVALGAFRAVAPATAGHREAVAACIERIAAGEISQANLCLRLEASFAGDPLALFGLAAGALDPPYAAALAGPWGALVSLSPELFLRRRGRTVVTEPITGTAPREHGDDRVMIVDVMRNDLGRVCEHGSVVAEAIAQPRAHPGVWHPVSTVRGTLRPGTGDEALLRATFPAGSVTGAPKAQAMRVISELEATGRQAYTGAIGYASPVAGLELSVAIRTFEIAGERIWLGAGGGIVADADPDAEVSECLDNARPLIAAAGGRLEAPAPGVRGRRPQALPADRPDPARGVFETLLVVERAAHAVDEHLARLARSVAALYDEPLPADLRERIVAAAGAIVGSARLRVVVAAGRVEVQSAPLPAGGEVVLAPFTLPGGLGAHKWHDRRLLDALGSRGATPLLADADGDVLEAAHANVFAVEGDALCTPALDGRLLPGTARERLIAQARQEGRQVREAPLSLERLAAADAIVLTSALRGPHAARLDTAKPLVSAR